MSTGRKPLTCSKSTLASKHDLTTWPGIFIERKQWFGRELLSQRRRNTDTNNGGRSERLKVCEADGCAYKTTSSVPTLTESLSHSASVAV